MAQRFGPRRVAAAALELTQIMIHKGFRGFGLSLLCILIGNAPVGRDKLYP